MDNDLKMLSGKVPPGTAVFSSNKLYRYTLTRNLKQGDKTVLFIGLNPSTATATEDDPTVRRMWRYAWRWGFSKCIVANIFAFRATDPREMYKAKDPVGKDNDEWIVKLRKESSLVIAAWGCHGAHQGRHEAVLKLLTPLGAIHCLERSKDNFPKHPLYLKGELLPSGYR